MAAFVEPDQQERSGQRPWALYPSPLRYPGGKRKLVPFMKRLFELNSLVDGDYVEVYAGGAAVALALLFEDFARRIHINDVDRGVYAFWMAARDEPDALCRRVVDAVPGMAEWERQRAAYHAPNPDQMDLAFATLFLNRTNRSGIITGGPIGGKAQSGDWRLDARWRTDDLVRRIQKVGRHAARIEVDCLDAADYLRKKLASLPARSLTYLDPPYVVKGKEMLYASFYEADDHAEIADLVTQLGRPWLVSYDDAPVTRSLYAAHRLIAYGISYSAQDRYTGREIMFVSDGLTLPEGDDPTRIRPVPPRLRSGRSARIPATPSDHSSGS